MTALTYLFLSSIYFLCVGLDIVMFFIQIRLVLLWRNVSWLTPFDSAGKPLVDHVIRWPSRWFPTERPLSQRGKLIITLLATALVRIALTSILKTS